MTQEEKELLLKDLCARLPYGVKCQFDDGCVYTLSPRHLEFFKFISNFNLKPYLRPLSSMTEEEKKEYNDLYYNAPLRQYNRWRDAKYLEGLHVDWLNKKMFDFRGLKGLAIEVTEENNPYK